MLGLLKFLIFLAVFVFCIFLSVKFNFKENKKFGTKEFEGVGIKPKGLILGIALFFLALIILPAIGAIPAGYRGVVLKFGAVTGRVLGEGIYTVHPFTETVKLMSVKVEAYEVQVEAASKDLQDVNAKITLNYFLESRVVGRTYQTLGYDYQTRIISPAIQEAVKSSTAQFDATELITKRPLVKEKIESFLKERIAIHGIIMDAVSITDFKFSPKFSESIENKVRAAQDVLTAQNNLEKIKIEADQKVAQAQAEAEALRLQKQQVTPELIALRKIEVQRLAIEVQLAAVGKWNGQLPNVTGGVIPFLDVNQQSVKADVKTDTK
ncbi:MAG: prohibitin family protein [Patescibacteria group bacterium]|nr:prohibitin family protein [Patescibacteria group bacterium]MDD5164437.1 prohibitin family protein [Patescibacteria group bacterium]MDD5534586.1 prohibitin family protein [Patescibacteria group bacterium]